MIQFHIADIHCDACIRSVTSAVRDVDDKALLHADLATKLVQIETSAAEGAVAEAIRDAGLTVEPAP